MDRPYNNAFIRKEFNVSGLDLLSFGIYVSNITMKSKVLVAALTLVTTASVGWAQGLTSAKIPLDPKVKVGKLSNGLTYYIRKNENPKQRAEFFIAQKVGSVLENESQLGLAHFLEHMAFNGTKNFPGDKLIKYCESIGVKFGDNINAYTSFEETVYNISNVPLTRPAIVDSMLLALHDWSCAISLENKEIDKERGVIREEWRTRTSGSNRNFQKIFLDVYPNNITGNRMPIGSIDVINNFTYTEIRDFYQKWYRPDLQAIVVVGDFDVNDMEARVKKTFSAIPIPVNPAKRNYIEVEGNAKPLVSVATDAEVPSTSVMVMYKKDATPIADRETEGFYRHSLSQRLMGQMMNARFYEISRQATPPFQGASASYSNFMASVTENAWIVSASPKNGEALEAFKSLICENERMRKFGFNPSELERAKTDYLRSVEGLYNEREKQKNGRLAEAYVSHFTTGEANPSIEQEYELVKSLLKDISVDEVNALASRNVTDSNMVIVVAGPQKDGIATPTKDELLAAMDQVKKESISAYQDKVISQPLLAKQPVAGKVVKTENAKFGYTKWTLSNGVKLYVKKTDHKKDQVIFTGSSKGGTSLMNIADRPNYSVINEVVSLGGLGEFDPIALDKILTGKRAGVSTSVSTYSEGVSGSASPKDLKTMFELTYLKFTAPRMDEVAFKNYVARKRNQLENGALNPMTALSDSIRKTLYGGHPLMSSYSVEMLEKVDYAKVVELYKQRFANAGDFTFFITGNVDVDTLKPLVETYLGGLPGTAKAESWKDLGINVVKGEKKVEFSKKISVPKTTVFAYHSGTVKYSLENIVLMNFLTSILDFRYTTEIREKEGGTYGVSVSGSIDKTPQEKFYTQISFDTDPKLKDKLLKIVHREIDNLVNNGPTAEEIAKVREFSLKNRQEMLLENSYWQSLIQSYATHGVDFDSEYENLLKKVTPQMVKKAAKAWFTQGNVVEVIMNPKQEE